MRKKFVLDRRDKYVCLPSLCLSQVLDKKNVWGKNTRCDVYLNHLLVLWSRSNQNILEPIFSSEISGESSWLLWRRRVNVRVCFMLKLFSHMSLLVLALTQMRRGISHGDEIMSTTFHNKTTITFLLNGIGYFLLYLQNATNILTIHRGVLLCTIWHWAAFHEYDTWWWLSLIYLVHNILKDPKGNIHQPV